jgi:hypothetical protein
VIGPKGGTFEFEITKTPKSYESTLSNGVKSRPLFDPGSYAFTFVGQNEKKGFKPFVG